MTFYIGVDLHPYQQTLCWCDEETDENANRVIYEVEVLVKRTYISHTVSGVFLLERKLL